jgi:Short C-terminal domain
VSDDAIQAAGEADEYSPPPVPPMPAVPSPSQMSRGRPYLLAEHQLRHSLGWQDHKADGPSFVVVQLSRPNRITVTARFPLTAQGWESAWRALSELDADAAAAVGAQLAKMEARRSARANLAELNARTVCHLRFMTYNGGSGDSPLVRGKSYDLRFLGDRLLACPPGSAAAVVELAYHDVEAVQVSGSDRSRSAGETVAVTLSVGVLGALLGLILLGFAGLVFGGLTFALIAAVAMASATRAKTVVRIRSQDAEYFFLNADKAPDALRIELSGPLTAIESARTARPVGRSEQPADRAPESILEQLSKLASLLADGVLSPEEFERLKAKVIARA